MALSVASPRPSWADRPAIIAASGPSLTRADCDVASRAGNVIAVNTSWRMAPHAKALYAADAQWWRHCAPPPDRFRGERWTQHLAGGLAAATEYGLYCIECRPGTVISSDPAWIASGANSAFQALGLALHWGATHIVFLGLDLHDQDGCHWHGPHPVPVRRATNLPGFLAAFEAAAPQLAAKGVRVINATPRSALAVWPKMPIAQAVRFPC